MEIEKNIWIPHLVSPSESERRIIDTWDGVSDLILDRFRYITEPETQKSMRYGDDSNFTLRFLGRLTKYRKMHLAFFTYSSLSNFEELFAIYLVDGICASMLENIDPDLEILQKIIFQNYIWRTDKDKFIIRCAHRDFKEVFEDLSVVIPQRYDVEIL